MRELDVLLSAYLETRYPESPAPRKSAFRALLELPDPELSAYLLQGVRPDSELIEDIVGAILRED